MTHSIVEAMRRDPCSVAGHEFLNSRGTGTMALVDIASANWFESGSTNGGLGYGTPSTGRSMQQTAAVAERKPWPAFLAQ